MAVFGMIALTIAKIKIAVVMMTADRHVFIREDLSSYFGKS
jgi:hypothetical protein